MIKFICEDGSETYINKLSQLQSTKGWVTAQNVKVGDFVKIGKSFQCVIAIES